MGLGAETGYQYLLRRELQHAVDVSAHAAAIRRRAGDDVDQIRAAALDVATKAGFRPASGTLELHWPPTSGPAAGDTDTVEVTLSRTVPRLLSGMFAPSPVTMHARAVSRVTLGSDACVLALAPTTAAALSISSSSHLALDCDAASNSMAEDSLSVAGDASLSAPCASTVGGALVNTSVVLSECDAVREYAPKTRDPYKTVTEPTVPATCNSNNKNVGNPSNTTTVTPSATLVSGMPVYRFCDGVMLKGDVTFLPGLYIISGGNFDANAGAIVRGTGVTFYITSPNVVSLNGHAQLILSAPTTGTLSGILFFGSRSASGIVHKINGTSGSVIQGALYAPTTAVEYTGKSSVSGAGGCTQIIAYTVTFSGSSQMASSCATAGTRDLKDNESVTLVE